MGRTRTKPKKRAQIEVSSSQSIVSNPSVPALYEKAQSLVDQCDYELAAKFLRRVLERESAHVQARELLGVVLLELGDMSTAQTLFESLINGPNSLPVVASAHLHLAQLCEDPRSALNHYQKAVDILYDQLKSKETLVQNGSSTEDLSQERQTIAKALVAMTEIWLTDLCMEPDAEQNCESLLNLAIQADPSNVDVLQSLASVRMSQQRPEDARKYVEQAWGLWKDLPPDDRTIPSIPSRLALTRLFLELLMYKEGLTILTGVIESDDQEVEAWYLEGWCLLLMSEDAKTQGVDIEGLSWNELAQDARDCLETCVSLFDTLNHPDKEMLAHAKELMGQLRDMGISASKEEVEVEEWEDVEDSDDEDVNMES